MDKIRKFPLSIRINHPACGLGILTEEPDYRISWLLNQNFPWDLMRSDDILVMDKKSSVQQAYSSYVSNYNYHPGIRLISNRSGEGYWLTEFRQVDFLLAISPQDPAGQYIDDVKIIINTKIHQIRGLFNIALPSFCYL